ANFVQTHRNFLIRLPMKSDVSGGVLFDFVNISCSWLFRRCYDIPFRIVHYHTKTDAVIYVTHRPESETANSDSRTFWQRLKAVRSIDTGHFHAIRNLTVWLSHLNDRQHIRDGVHNRFSPLSIVVF